ncbi:DsbA family protein, partial [Enhygromyxa salina]|uniref:DsbA family protein n=1 Tax=Enhygromyxa salina TaxID=215803 RepID=UPI0015E600CE
MRPRAALALAVLISLLGCRQPSAALELPTEESAEPTGLDTPGVFVEAATFTEARVLLDWTEVDDRFASLVDGERYRVDYDADHPWAGATTPLVTIVVFFDYQCPYCHRLDDALADLLARYPDRLRVVWRQFPLKMHPQAEFAAAVALAAHTQGAFMPMHQWLFDNGGSLSPTAIEHHAASLGLDAQRLLADVDSGWYGGRVNADVEFGERFLVRSTPSYFINGRPFRGAKKVEELEPIVQDELRLAERMIAAGAEPREVWARILAASAEQRAPAPSPT